MCVRLTIYGPQNQKKRKDRQKVFYGHRLTQINTDGNHKLLINFRRSALLCSVTVKRRMNKKEKISVLKNTIL